MSLFRTLLLWPPLAAGLTQRPALADPPRDADRAFRRQRRRAARCRCRKIERRVMPLMGGADYLGPELNGGTYRFKFMQDGRVIWVDVDGQSGRIIRRSQAVALRQRAD